MTLNLKRTAYTKHGIYSTLTMPDGTAFHTLEHAYYDGKDPMTSGYSPKVKNGQYTCVRGMHRLKVDKPAFSTFEVTGVKGHIGILFHVGNFNEDSDGCILVGLSEGPKMITSSKLAFGRFLELLKGVSQFTLVVEG